MRSVTSTIALDGKQFPVRFSYSVIASVEERHGKPISVLMESGRIKPSLDLMIEGLKAGARRSGERMLSDQEYMDILDDNPEWTEQLPALMSQLSAPEGADKENPR